MLLAIIFSTGLWLSGKDAVIAEGKVLRISKVQPRIHRASADTSRSLLVLSLARLAGRKSSPKSSTPTMGAGATTLSKDDEDLARVLALERRLRADLLQAAAVDYAPHALLGQRRAAAGEGVARLQAGEERLDPVELRGARHDLEAGGDGHGGLAHVGLQHGGDERGIEVVVVVVVRGVVVREILLRRLGPGHRGRAVVHSASPIGPG